MLYHLYNQGNKGSRIFFSDQNYIYFLQKVKRHLVPHCEIIAWCLMPNHFHFLIFMEERMRNIKSGVKVGKTELSIFSNNLRVMLSSYARAINKQQGVSGSLFRQNTKMKKLGQVILGGSEAEIPNYAQNCFIYLHQNPYAAGLVNKIEDCPYSSYRDYAGLRPGRIVNRRLACELIGFEEQDFCEIVTGGTT